MDVVLTFHPACFLICIYLLNTHSLERSWILFVSWGDSGKPFLKIWWLNVRNELLWWGLLFVFSHVGWCWVQNVRSVRIDYSIEKAETGIHFRDNVLHTDNQMRRARCWFPCIDDNLQQCWYGMLNTSHVFMRACSHFILITVLVFTMYCVSLKYFFFCCSCSAMTWSSL